MTDTPDPCLEPMLSVKDVAALLNTSTKTVLRRIQSGKLRAFVDGDLVRIPPSEYRRYVVDHLFSDEAS